MSLIRALFVFVSFSAVTVAFPCQADQYPQPWNLASKWLDRFTVNISWKKPLGLADQSGIKYYLKNIQDNDEIQVAENKLEAIRTLLTEENRTDRWTYHIRTIGENCSQSNENDTAVLIIQTEKPRDDVVKDFKCFIDNNKMNCSWIPANRSQNLVLSYRIKGREQKEREQLIKCKKTYSNGERDGCFLDILELKNILFLVETDTAMMTFDEPVIELRPPKLTVKQEGPRLKLSWNTSDFGHCLFVYNVCYSECNKPLSCPETTPGQASMEVPYDESCQYEFKSRVMTTEYCFFVSSIFSEPEIYGTNKTPDKTLTAVAIVIPIILSACVILSCYCFRRHRAIICPVIPDPSAIFKEMIMNGNSDKVTQTKLYTPVPEPIEPCKITLVNVNSPI